MLNLLGNSLQIDLSPNSIVLHRVKGFFRKKSELINDRNTDHVSIGLSELWPLLQARLTELKISRINAEVIIPDECVRYFTVTPPVNTQSLRDCQIAAEMRFRNLYEDNLAEWTLQADWNAQNNFVACATPNSLLNTLKEIATHCSLSLSTVRPHFITACNLWRKKLKKNDWFCVMCGDTLSVGIFSHSGLLAVRVSTIADEKNRGSFWFREHLARESLRLNVQVPSQVHLYIHQSAHWIADSKDPLHVDKIETNFYRVRFMSEKINRK